MNKTLILLVGPMGAGKSTRARKLVDEGYVRINQDEQGKNEHRVKFGKAVTFGSNIVVDRINHKREERRQYIEIAKKAGYSTKIVIMNESFRTCMERLQGRTGHPTLSMEGPNSLTDFRKALSMYFAHYEHPRSDEADIVVDESVHFPYMLDISSICQNRRVFVVGDVHGCFDELMELLDKATYRAGLDVLIFVGDLVDRGPKIREVLEFASQTPLVYSVLSNHDYKYLRYIRGGKVDTASLSETIRQVPDVSDELRYWFESLPQMIRFAPGHYVIHAGINPKYSMERQSRETLLYARTYDPSLNGFANKSAPGWYTYEYKQAEKILFGHAPMEEALVAPHAVALDGGCVFGGKLRLWRDGEIIEVDAKKAYSDHHVEPEESPRDYHPSLEPFEEKVSQKLVSRSLLGDLVLYNYTKQCQYDKVWDDYTLQARGIIFNRKTGDIVARPFRKFFNVGETENTLFHNLPKEKYEIFNKEDGSLGIMLWPPGEATPRIATRGSFYSAQAAEANKILTQYRNFEHLDRRYTLLFEIIFPENSNGTLGDRLVVDYGTDRKLILLAAINKFTGKDLSRGSLEMIADLIGCDIAPVFAGTIEEAIELQSTLPPDKEGFVVLYESGLRVKIKGHEYLRLSRLYSRLGPLTIWETIGKDGKVPAVYLATIPEEILPFADNIVKKLEQNFFVQSLEILKEVIDVTGRFNTIEDPKEKRKAIGLWLQSDAAKHLKHKHMVFPFLNRKLDQIAEYTKELIRPKGNQIE